MQTLRYIITFCEDQPVGPALATIDGVYDDTSDPLFYDPHVAYLVCSHTDFEVAPGQDLHVTMIIPGLPARADDTR